MDRNYIQRVIDMVASELPDNDPYLNEFYALLVLTTGERTTLHHVHEAWGVWRNDTRPDHPALIPFWQLATEVQELDREYQQAIIRVATRIRHEGVAA